MKAADHDSTWDLDWDTLLSPLAELEECSICPRDCHADRRSDRLGYCRSGAGYSVSSIFAHMGEEPVLSGTRGICNIFFTHCNLQCLYCQNYQISRNREHTPEDFTRLTDIIVRVEDLLDHGAHGVGFVSPSHFIPQMKVIMNVLEARGRKPVYVFNTNGYDRVEMLKELDGRIQVYLPDLKYLDEKLAREYSDAPRYPEIATTSLREMYRQKGANIFLSDEGTVESGLIIRHLVLPGHVENSKAVLRFIADELSPSVHISLMSQYYPTCHVADHPSLSRTLRGEEYDEVLEEFERLGFYRGWVQELSSSSHYRPDFDKERPFED